MLIRHRQVGAIAAALAALTASSSSAQIVPVAQARSVHAEASHFLGTPSSDTDVAVDFGPYDGRAGASSGSQFEFSYAAARQISTIGYNRIQA